MGTLALLRRPVSVKRGADERVISIEESPGTPIQFLQVRADNEPGLGKPFPAEISDRFQQVDPQQRLAALELDLDVRPLQSAKE